MEEALLAEDALRYPNVCQGGELPVAGIRLVIKLLQARLDEGKLVQAALELDSEVLLLDLNRRKEVHPKRAASDERRSASHPRGATVTALTSYFF